MDGAERSRFSRRAFAGAGGAIALAGGAALALRGSGFGPLPGADNFTLRRGNNAEPDTLDPHLGSTTYEFCIVGEMFLGLMTENPAAEQIPGAAESWRTSDDGLTWTFRIRDHRWSDGTPVTAEDFVYSFRRVLDPDTASQYGSVLYPIRNAEAVNARHMPVEALGVRAIDSRTLEVRFEVEVPYAPQLLAQTCTYPVPRHVIAKYGESWTRPGIAVGNGPYVLKEWIPNDHVVLEKNPHFYDARNVKISRVVVYATPDYAAALMRFRAGELDINVDVPSQDIAWVRKNLPGTMRVAPYMLIDYLVFNVHAKPVDDIRVRTALSLAIDREMIAGRIMGAGEAPAWSFVPPHMPDYPYTAQLRLRSHSMQERRARAIALLAEAGYGLANPLTLDFNVSNGTSARTVSVALQSMWKDIGANVRIVPREEKDHYNLLIKQEFSVAWSAYVADYADARDFLMLGQTNAYPLNDSGYSNPAFDALLARADRIGDPRARGAVLAAAEQIMLDDAAVAPVFFGVTRTLVAPAVKNWVDNPVNIHRARWLSLDRSRANA
ncbi:MAG TPA: peptide ABC transporter substrate-binding protein [Rhizomicrobium sp.]|nr:peptide ABC transporter substrate-binding protein [Rhizomicrobium sp.]